MARFSYEERDLYGGQANGSFFSLQNDGDIASVRFMYETIDDVEGYAVHKIEVDGKERYVNCLREHGQEKDVCPLCAAGYNQLAKLFVPLYDTKSEEVKIWERGKTFFSKLGSLCARYNPLCGTIIEIERIGKKGDTNTKYETYVIESDETTLEDLPELPIILGGLVLDKSFEELEYYLDMGRFEDSEEINVPTQRRRERTQEAPREMPTRGRAERGRRERPTGRRVPTNTADDAF